MSTETETVYAITADASHLHELIKTTIDLTEDACLGDFRSPELYEKWISGRIVSLLYIARSLSEKIQDDLTSLPPMERKVPCGSAPVEPDQGDAV